MTRRASATAGTPGTPGTPVTSARPPATGGGAGRAGGYPRARQRTRGALLAAARSVLADRGVEGATAAEVAARAGVSPGSLYNHFGDLAGLLDAVADDLLAELDEALAGVAALDRPAEERFVLGIDTVLRLAERDPVWGWCMVRFEATVSRVRAALSERVGHNLRGGIAEGTYVPVGDEVAVGDLLIGTLLTATLSRLEGRATGADNGAVAELLLRALGLTPARASRAVARALG